MAALIPPRSLLEAVGAVGPARPVAAGFSGGRVFRVHTAGGDRALKAWPVNTSASRIQQVHQVQTLAQRYAPTIDRFGDASFLKSGNRFWESASWIDGAPLNVTASLNEVLEGVDVIARFHHTLAPHESRTDLAPAVRDRIETSRRLEPAVDALSRARLDHRSKMEFKTLANRQGSELLETLDRALKLICHRGVAAMKQIRQMMHRHAVATSSLHWCLRDVHREHILLRNVPASQPSSAALSLAPGSDERYGSGERSVAGILDFDAVRIDVAETDLSRWLSSFTLPGHSWDEMAVAAVNRFSEESAALADPVTEGSLLNRPSASLVVDLMVATAWISLTQWCVWLVLEKRTFPVSPGIQSERIGFWCDQISHRLGGELG